VEAKGKARRLLLEGEDPGWGHTGPRIESVDAESRGKQKRKKPRGVDILGTDLSTKEEKGWMKKGNYSSRRATITAAASYWEGRPDVAAKEGKLAGPREKGTRQGSQHTGNKRMNCKKGMKSHGIKLNKRRA